MKFTIAILAVSMLAFAGCSSHSDIETVGSMGGFTSPTYSGPLAECPPVAAIDFSPLRKTITDDDLAAILPALRRLNPHRISLGGQPITDRSIDMLNQLSYLEEINLEGTKVTPQGLARLKLSHWE